MSDKRKLFGLDQEITLSRRGSRTTIRQQHQNGKVVTRPDPQSLKMSQSERWADVEDDDGSTPGVTFLISEADFNYLRGEV
jgi:hypothetical protein